MPNDGAKDRAYRLAFGPIGSVAYRLGFGLYAAASDPIGARPRNCRRGETGMLAFDLTGFYSLFEAFDRTGRRIFGTDWRGNEAFAQRVDDPQATRAEREAILARLRQLAMEAAPHDAMMVVEAGREAHEVASRALAPIRQEVTELRQALHDIPEVSDSWVSDHDAYMRRRRVEDELRQAFSRGDLSLQVGPSGLVAWDSWSRLADFRVYFGLSMVRLPSKYAGRNRRGPAFVPRVAFDAWLDRFERPGPAQGELTPAERLRHWLEDEARRFPVKPRLRDEYWQEAQTLFPGLSRRQFDRVWALTVPDSWKRPGPLDPGSGQ